MSLGHGIGCNIAQIGKMRARIDLILTWKWQTLVRRQACSETVLLAKQSLLRVV